MRQIYDKAIAFVVEVSVSDVSSAIARQFNAEYHKECCPAIVREDETIENERQKKDDECQDGYLKVSP